MRKIAFYLNNPGLGQVDCSSILESNPGIGGTEYMFFVICLLLTRTNRYHITLFVNEPPKGLPELDLRIVSNIESAINSAECQNYDLLIFRHSFEYVKTKPIHCLSDRLSLFVWTHNFTNRLELDYYDSIPNIKRIVCVGRELRDVYLDHPCIRKMCYIYNTLNTSQLYREKVLRHPYSARKNIVVHIGSIVPGKGFHLLARVWKDVLKEVPDAELFVIGNGKVYDRTKQMGKYGIAQQEYENCFIPYLTENGKILSSVHFLGSMGKEKDDFLLQAKVGVPNPESAVWGETFCLAAVEMQLCGVTVIGGECPGYYDTFFNGRIVTQNNLKDAIVRQLKSDHPVLDFEATYQKIVSRFSNEVVLEKWKELLDSDYNSKLPAPLDCCNWSYRGKWIKYFLSYLKSFFPIFRNLLPFDNVLQKLRF